MSGTSKKERSTQTEAMELAEAARETQWEHPSFAGELFMGRFHPHYILPFPEAMAEDKREGDVFIAKLEKFLRENVDPDEIDRSKELPKHVLKGLIDLGAFGMKIPREYGGLGLSQVNYNRAMMTVASYCNNVAVWLSAHQSIGVPQPLKLFGTPEQKKKFLPRLAKGEISAFALTEPSVGSDPAQMSTTATRTPDGKHYLITGEKLWCTNGPVADVIVVMAKTAPKQITAFIVETDSPGFEVVHRCEFLGLKGIQNGLLRFKDLKVPKENILWGEGKGLKLALVTLNTGRLTLPAACVGGAKQCLNILRDWANERVQWGAAIGKHEAVASKLAWMSAYTFAMEAVTLYASQMVDQGDRDIRLEAAMAKLFCSEAAWKIIDETLQVRGGRGYETADSLRARNEKPYPVERMMRDSRINTIIEGSSEIMRLFIAREALDPHLKLGMKMFDPRADLKAKVNGFLKMAAFYARWYPRQWMGWKAFFRHRQAGKLARHLRFVERNSHKLARSIFHAMGRYRLGLEKHQQVLGRLVDVGTGLYAMAAACSRALSLAEKETKYRNALDLADLFCRYQRREIRRSFRELFHADDAVAYKISQRFLSGEFAWLEENILRAMEAPEVETRPEKVTTEAAVS